MKRFKVPPSKALGIRVAMEVVAILILTYPMLHIYIILQGDMEPVQRGFFCDDQALKHPNVKEEISVGEAVIIWACISILIVPAIEILHLSVYSEGSRQPRVCNIPWIVVELYRMIGYCILGGLCTLLTTEMAKYKIGRHRPYFLSVCGLDLSPDLCKDSNGYNIFVTNYTCPGDPYEVREASKSFMSGHSSFSFYCATFLIVYLHARLRSFSVWTNNTPHTYVSYIFRGLKILRPFLQFGIFSLAFYISLTRITDYKHHPGDVLCGIFVGVLFAVIILNFLMDLFHRPRSFKIEDFNSDLDAVDNVMQMVSQSGEPSLSRTTAQVERSNSDSLKPLSPKDNNTSSTIEGH